MLAIYLMEGGNSSKLYRTSGESIGHNSIGGLKLVVKV